MGNEIKKQITDFKTFEDLENILSAHGGWGKFEGLIFSATEQEFSGCSKAEIDGLLTLFFFHLRPALPWCVCPALVLALLAAHRSYIGACGLRTCAPRGL